MDPAPHWRRKSGLHNEVGCFALPRPHGSKRVRNQVSRGHVDPAVFTLSHFHTHRRGETCPKIANAATVYGSDEARAMEVRANFGFFRTDSPARSASEGGGSLCEPPPSLALRAGEFFSMPAPVRRPLPRPEPGHFARTAL